jgi:hypothetical protein
LFAIQLIKLPELMNQHQILGFSLVLSARSAREPVDKISMSIAHIALRKTIKYPAPNHSRDLKLAKCHLLDGFVDFYN